MHAQILAKKRLETRNETQLLASSLGEKLGFNVDPERFNARHRDPKVQALRQEEAVRDFLQELEEAVSGEPSSLESVEGIGDELAEKLKEAGFHTVDDLRSANPEDLVVVDGVGPSKAKKLQSL